MLDLVRLAERGVSDVAALVAGDRDFAEAVRVAQEAGRTVVLAVPPGAGMAKELRQLADLVVVLPPEWISQMLVPTTWLRLAATIKALLSGFSRLAVRSNLRLQDPYGRATHG